VTHHRCARWSDHDWRHRRYRAIAGMEELRCARCPAVLMRAVRRCACWIPRPRAVMHPIYRTEETLMERAADQECEACAGSGFVVVDVDVEEPGCCCCGTTRRPWTQRCGNCQRARGLIHVCDVDWPEDLDEAARLLFSPAEPKRGPVSDKAKWKAQTLEF